MSTNKAYKELTNGELIAEFIVVNAEKEMLEEALNDYKCRAGRLQSELESIKNKILGAEQASYSMTELFNLRLNRVLMLKKELSERNLSDDPECLRQVIVDLQDEGDEAVRKGYA